MSGRYCGESPDGSSRAGQDTGNSKVFLGTCPAWKRSPSWLLKEGRKADQPVGRWRVSEGSGCHQQGIGQVGGRQLGTTRAEGELQVPVPRTRRADEARHLETAVPRTTSVQGQVTEATGEHRSQRQKHCGKNSFKNACQRPMYCNFSH